MYEPSQRSDRIQNLIEQAKKDVAPFWENADRIATYHQSRLLKSFRTNQVSEFHFQPSTGYGYDDSGRETLEAIYADIFQTEAAIVRPQFTSGTHTITTALFGVLRPGDDLLYMTGQPYDTLHGVIGGTEDESDSGSLADFQVTYRDVPLHKGHVDFTEVGQMIKEKCPKVVAIQRSKGYDDRPSFTIADIEEMIRFVKAFDERIIIFVDNCYGEFVEENEPGFVGADLMAGSLIKNPGGGLAKTGGYIAGREDLVEKCACRLTAPGIGREAGAMGDSLREMYHGIFLAPHTVNQAVKGAMLTARLLELCGMDTSPRYDAPRTDLIQSVSFPDAHALVRFCQAIQQASPVDAHVLPEPSPMPGYTDHVIMAAGTFIQGSSIELTADGPIRPPYQAFVQGGLTLEHVKVALAHALDMLVEEGLITL
ncbi:aminotransferase class I/II-fold pyridoxal phosphate-dependent enzyme [Texcoconibacillus texcoconensis]|uniref:Cystathionine beta-lyase family protein involved in aluminum resistance n=1 Tax=Texcoconibacillus texcoconensis TaxID=1095777 RepID=A0A840QUS6_9BACI|nr:methionine gamma-lyase family protein [Texcoconibacillus texcoconensis]MBB5175090.1 cystathionine beta-lyase family protein involved in aluminum resistance [Texcoconibacillus texcoconensis]